ncbi:hypothetical protein [Aeromonas caviae]|uniref:hypothetical protein n=1 Tax=Aeromonas caviae TaxID=648 RepID=UPI0015DCDF7B|nr:hypothetical protein [Aeromonas caviae]BBS17796.1 hypothetical protein WP5W18E02_28330 [Aeromonas caviae]
MDPISYLFSAYLNLVQQQVTDIYGTELKTLVVPYEGEQAGIQIISATLMDEWREVANC